MARGAATPHASPVGRACIMAALSCERGQSASRCRLTFARLSPLQPSGSSSTEGGLAELQAAVMGALQAGLRGETSAGSASSSGGGSSMPVWTLHAPWGQAGQRGAPLLLPFASVSLDAPPQPPPADEQRPRRRFPPPLPWEKEQQAACDEQASCSRAAAAAPGSKNALRTRQDHETPDPATAMAVEATGPRERVYQVCNGFGCVRWCW